MLAVCYVLPHWLPVWRMLHVKEDAGVPQGSVLGQPENLYLPTAMDKVQLLLYLKTDMKMIVIIFASFVSLNFY